MPTVLLILPTGTYRADEYLAAARRLGAEVVVGSERAQALAATMGGHFLELPLDDPAGTAEAIVAHDAVVPLDAVVAVDDTGSIGAAIAAEQLRLRHNPPEAVRTTRDKVAMRRAFARHGVAQPDFEVLAPDGDGEGDDDGGGGGGGAVAAAARRIGYPVVVKPPSLAGSRGVIRADDDEAAEAAAAWTRRILVAAGEPADSPLIVEEFVAGPEVAVEGLLRSGQLEVIAVFDKPDPLEGPYFEETLYVTPSGLLPPLLDEVVAETARAAKAIGLTDGPVHAELRVPGALPGWGTLHSGPPTRLLEVAARTIGGRCSKALALRGGSLEELVLSAALGVPGPEPELEQAAGVLMIPIPRSGRLVEVHGQDEARAVQHVTGVEVTVPRGRFVGALPEGERYLGFVFAAGATATEVETALRRAEDLLTVEIAEADGGASAEPATTLP